ncbi:MAG: glycosyltransferase family 52 protein [Cetobacterium sp.]|nr:glycosyltransferase family 52 protein [Cetobacterium sp.]
MKMADNLILCATPLQVLIAERIIEKHPGESFSLIMITYDKNEKYLYYFNRLKKKCKTAKLLNINGKWLTLFYVIYFRLSMLDKKAKRVFLSNIDNIIFQTILSMLDKTEVYTFDDGMANIDKTSFLYRPEIRSKIKKYLKINIDIDKIKKRSIKHYTIYNIQYTNNIIPDVKQINLFSTVHMDNKRNDEKSTNITIVLGQPIFEFIKDSNENKNKLNMDITKKLINYSQATLYFPHPRKKYHIQNIDYIETNLIFEDFIYKEVKNNPHITYDIYTFFSSAGLNIITLPNVRVHFCQSSQLPKQWDGVYDLLKSMNIDIETID